jgi:hypothetical protein
VEHDADGLKVEDVMQTRGQIVEQVGKIAAPRDGLRQLKQRQVLTLLYIKALDSVNAQGLFSLFSVDDCKKSYNHFDSFPFFVSACCFSSVIHRLVANWHDDPLSRTGGKLKWSQLRISPQFLL